VPAASWCGGRFWFLVRDPYGWVCSVLAHLLVVGIATAVNVYILLPSTSSGWLAMARAIAYNGVVLSVLACHLRCMCTNPGTAKDHLDQELQQTMRSEFERLRAAGLPADAAARSRLGSCEVLGARPQKWWCVSCETFRPKHTHHCSTCRCCVLEMDHHCPWVNNCVGLRNHKFFLLFLSYAWIACAWSLMAIVSALCQISESPDELLHWTTGSSARRSWLDAHVRPLHSSLPAQIGCMSCGVLCFLLVIFISVMGCDQWEYMAQGYGVVDKLLLASHKAPRPSPPWAKVSREPCTERLQQVLGGGRPLGLRWFLPVANGPMDFACVPKEELPVRCDGDEAVDADSSPSLPSAHGKVSEGPGARLGQASRAGSSPPSMSAVPRTRHRLHNDLQSSWPSFAEVIRPLPISPRSRAEPSGAGSDLLAPLTSGPLEEQRHAINARSPHA